MKLAEIYAQSWAIDEKFGQSYLDVFKKDIDFAQMKAMYDEKKDKEAGLSSVQNGVGIIEHNGIILKNGGLCNIGTVELLAELKKLGENNDVKSVLFSIDSGGGQVSGTETLSNFVANFSARYKKPLYAFVDDLAASAAYWIVSGADKIFISGESAMLGSIGTVLTKGEKDETQQQIYANKSFNKDSSKAMNVDFVSKINDVFLNSVKKNRLKNENFVNSLSDIITSDIDENVSVPKILSGLIFSGNEAIENGLADAIETKENVLSEMMNLSKAKNKQTSTRYKNKLLNKNENIMFENILKKAFAFFKSENKISSDVAFDDFAAAFDDAEIKGAIESEVAKQYAANFNANFEAKMKNNFDALKSEISGSIETLKAELKQKDENTKKLSSEIAALKNGVGLQSTTQTNTLQDEFEQKIEKSLVGKKVSTIPKG